MLTPKQEQFVQNILTGMNQADAYRDAYDTKRMSDKSVWEAASKLMANTKVATRLSELREQLVKPTIMTAQKRLEWLTDLIASEEEDSNVKLKAIDIMNKMQGEYVQKVQAAVETETTINIELVDDDEC